MVGTTVFSFAAGLAVGWFSHSRLSGFQASLMTCIFQSPIDTLCGLHRT